MVITPRDCVPRDWTRLLGNGEIGIGLDLATTDKDTSNPSSLTVTEKIGVLKIQRLVINWKTAKEAVTRGIVRVVFMDLAMAKIRPRKLCIDATNERFFAQRIQKELQHHCTIELVIASEGIEWRGEKMDMKTVVGNLYVESFQESTSRLPDARWLKDDHRLVKKIAGRFVSDTSPEGRHGDTFTSGSLSHWALQGRGRAEASGVPVGRSAGGGKDLSQLKNPLLRRALANQRNQRTTHA
jgi:hypothetical protein